MDATPAIQLIEKSKHIGLVLPADINHDVRVSAEVLVQFLTSRNIYVGIVTPFRPLDTAAHPDKSRQDLNSTDPLSDTALPSLASLKPLTKESIISLDTRTAPISQLRYENANDRVDIILSPSSSAVIKDHISFREGDIQCDCIITLGIPDIEQIDTSAADISPSFFSETPIIALDISEKHKNYAEIALLDSSLASLSELIYRFLASFPNHTIPAQSATLLLSGILHRTEGFTVITNANTLLSGHELIRIGAHYETAHAISRISTPFSLMPLIGRALARSKKDAQKNILWSSITQDDFLATHRTPEDAPDVLKRIKKEFSHARACVLLWQDINTKKIHAHIAADVPILTLLCQRTNGEFKDIYTELTDTYDSFPDAERVVTTLLDTVL